MEQKIRPSQIKICGIRFKEDIEIINNFDIGYIGFVFAESKRRVSKEIAFELKKLLKSNIKTVGVFVDMSVEEVLDTADFVGLDIVQLHSDEDNLFCEKIANKYKVWKSISIKDKNSVRLAENYKYVDGFLLDTYNKKVRGGTGNPFSWEYVENFSEKYFTILAGGISSDNIFRAYNSVKPNVIDLSSSVEADGKKDYYKIDELMRRIKDEQ